MNTLNQTLTYKLHNNFIKKPIKKIGIFDSGLGGMTILQSLINLPVEEFIYVADTAHIPYGNKSVEELTQLSTNIVKFLLQQHVDLIIVACHTISAVALSQLQHSFAHIPFIGMIDIATYQALTHTKNKIIGVMATQASISSHAHKNALLSRNSEISVVEQACPLLVPLIEQSECNKHKLFQTLQYYLEPLIEQNIDTLILGCTHYAIVKNEIQQIVGKTSIISSDTVIASCIEPYIKKNSSIPAQKSFFITGSVEDFMEKSKRVFDWYSDESFSITL